MNRLTWIAALALTSSLLYACGGAEEDTERARNLLSGEISSFAKGQVPPGWVPCGSSVECPVPPTVTCEKLGTKACALNPTCRLKEVSCQGEACACPACAPGSTCPPCTCPPPKPPVCEYTCIPKLPLLCEELGDLQQCSARPDCEWGEGPCSLMPCAFGQPCPPCPKTCRAKTSPKTCQSLDEKSCAARSDCQWDLLACPAVCQPDGKGGCLPCPAKGVCNPKAPLPPPPPPCPTIAPLPPGFCVGGTIVGQKDKNGCVIGFTCQLPNQKACDDLNSAYIAAVAKAKVCNPYSMMPVQECGKLVDSALYCPICPSFVSIFATAALKELSDLRATWLALSCDKLQVMCPMIACQAPKSASCVSTPGGSSGVCTNNQP